MYVRLYLLSYRYVFNKIEQNVEESVNNFANRIRHQAARCDFRDHIHDFMRDRFIVGLANENLRNFFLTKNSLTFEDAYNLSRVVEENGVNLTTPAPIVSLSEDSYTALGSQSSIMSLQPSCPSEELVFSVYSRSPAIENTRSGADTTFPPNSHVFPSQNGPAYPSGAPSQMYHSRPETEPENRSYVAVGQDLRHTRGNPHRPVEDAEKEPHLQPVTTSLPKKYAVGTYVVRKQDLKSVVQTNISIWRVCSPSFLQEFTPYVNQDGVIEYINYGTYITHTDLQRLSFKKYYEAVTIMNETIKVDVFGRQVTTVRLENDIFKRKKDQATKTKRYTVSSSRNEIAIHKPKSTNISKLKKTGTGKVKKVNGKQKIRHQICLGLVNLMCCCV